MKKQWLKYFILMTVMGAALLSCEGMAELFHGPKPPETYTVTFNANGASGTPPLVQNIVDGEVIHLPDQGGLSRGGNIFGGWSESTVGTGIIYSIGSLITVTRNITLYAQWLESSTPQYSVTFNANGANSGASPASQTVYSGISITIPGSGTLANSGKTFGGWNTHSNGGGTNYESGSIYKVTGDVTLYAKWNSASQFTVTYHANGAGGSAPSSHTVDSGTEVTLPEAGNLTYSGRTFGGWNTLANGQGTNYETGDTYTVTANVTLYAKWNSVSQYTVIYNANGAGGAVPTAQTVNPETQITLPGAGSLTYSGRIFGGWNTQPNGEGSNYNAGVAYTVNGDITFYAKWIVNSSIIEMVWINPGIYTRGSSNNLDLNASPPHQVTLTKGFYMGIYEVTQEQYQEVMGVNPSNFSSSPASGEVQERRPVEQVTWYDAVEFCNKLSALEGLSPAYTITNRSPSSGYPITGAMVNVDWNTNGYRLPTEAEWEYACRAGSITAYNTGETITDNTGWYSSNSGSRTHEVGKKPPNAWGLYDMHGNAWEWCWDWYGSYSSSAQTDPRGAASSEYRVFRGGSWNNNEWDLRSAYRRYGNQSYGYDSDGFRLLRP